MNKDLMRKAGFGEQVDLVEKGKCPLCKTTVDSEKLRGVLCRREFEISGLCPSCQDDVFAEG